MGLAFCISVTARGGTAIRATVLGSSQRQHGWSVLPEYILGVRSRLTCTFGLCDSTVTAESPSALRGKTMGSKSGARMSNPRREREARPTGRLTLNHVLGWLAMPWL
ncbi:hypothetical protein C440_01615 [Haloferax mucosum ATCC BAA-1512]|uniref:Uncharacterized protein n=1 Tax=Haloferax mucosum ATCC BAA-1512 TaxID=662479 RepID=M0ITA4_9EURY|nr:hypothetical protein C440_01615 [Haloferax mucosum ATCC BAA-1512]